MIVGYPSAESSIVLANNAKKMAFTNEETLSMDAETLEKCRERLLTLQRQVEQRVFRLETELYNMEADRNIEYMDHAQEEAVNDEMIALDKRSRQQVQEIQAALRRIEDGTYGECTRCGEPINPKRLEMMPTTHFCIRCQEQLETSA
jgi:DnaK suppressor protein